METKWNLTHIFKDDQEWERNKDIFEKNLKVFDEKIVSMMESKTDFLQTVTLKLQVDELIEKIYCYPRRFIDINSEDEHHQSLFQKALQLFSQLQIIENNFEKKCLENKITIEKWIKNTDHQTYLKETLRKKDHLPQNDISYLATANNDIMNLYRALKQDIIWETIIDEDGKKIAVTNSNYEKLSQSQNQEIRKNAYEAKQRSYQNNIHILTSLWNAKMNVQLSQVRNENFASILEKALFENDLKPSIIEILLKTIHKHLSIIEQYVEIKKQILHVDRLYPYDSNLSICKIPSLEYPFEQALEIVKDSLHILGDDYLSHIDQALQEGWIDVYPNSNKRKGSYSCITFCGVPYTLLNYNQTIVSVKTLAHELGHAIHTQYAKKQPFEYFEYSLFLAETASKVNEFLLFENMYQKSTDKEEQIYILNSYISSIINSLFGQSMLTEFEYSAITKKEKGESLQADTLNHLYEEIYQKYNCGLEKNTYTQYAWCQIPHFFEQDSYYVYQYAIGTAIACCITYNIQTAPETFIPKYQEYLQTGKSKSIVDSLKIIDIDLSQEDYLNKIFQLLKEKMDLLQELTKIEN